MKYIFLLFPLLFSSPCMAQTGSFSSIGLFTSLRSNTGYPINSYTAELNEIGPYLGKTVRVTGEFAVLTIPQNYSDPQEGQPALLPSFVYLIKNPKVEILAEDLTRFKKKLELAFLLVKTKPPYQDVMRQPIDGFRFNAPNAFNYSLSDPDGNTVQVYLHRDTQTIVFVKLTENVTEQQEITTYLTQSLNYTWIGSEHLCDYLNNGAYAIQICPDSEYGIQIHVSSMAD